MGGTLQKHGETAEDLSNVQPFGTIRILSYNLFMRPPAPHFTHNVVNDLKDERLEIFQQQLKDYDVICLQVSFPFRLFAHNAMPGTQQLLQECFGAFSSRRGRLIEEARCTSFSTSARGMRCPVLTNASLFAFQAARFLLACSIAHESDVGFLGGWRPADPVKGSVLSMFHAMLSSSDLRHHAPRFRFHSQLTPSSLAESSPTRLRPRVTVQPPTLSICAVCC